MRVLSRIRQSRAKIATAVSALLIAVMAAGIGFAPAASASAGTTAARPASVTAGAVTAGTVRSAATVKPDEEVTYYGGKYSTITECIDSLDEIRTNPNFAGGECIYSDGAYYLYYTLDLPVCGVVIAARTDVIAGKVAEPAC
jgi:hypothetical protein